MAEETEIVNVGGEGVASEATLLLLLRAMNKGGKSSGDQDKVQQMYNQSQKDGIKIIDTGNDTSKKKNKILKTTNEALKKFSSTLGDAAVSGMFGVFASMKNMSAELLTGGDTLSDFAQHIPLIGGHLGLLTGMIDDNLSAFRELSAVGARFGDGLNDIRAASANAAMPLDEFVTLVSQNSMVMRGFGSSVAEGATNFAAMSKQLRDGPGKSLMGLGFTSTELNELLVDYAELQAGSFTRDRVQGRISAANAAKFGEQLNGLAAATGKRRDQIMEEIKASQADIRMRAAMSRYTGDEGERFRANIGTVSGISKSLGDALLDFDDGIPSNASTQRLMQMSSTFEQFGQDVENMDPRELNNFVVDVRKDLEEFAKANNTTVEELGRTVPGLQDIFGVISETKDMGNLTLKAYDDIVKKAEAEKDRLAGLKQLEKTIKDFRGALMSSFIESDVLKVITESFDSVAVGLQEFIKSDAFKDGLKDLAETIKTFISNFQNFDLKTALFGGKATKDVFDKDGKKVTSKGDDVEGLFGGDGEFNVGEMFGNFIGDAFASLLPSMDTVLVGIAAVLGTLLLTAVTGPFALIGIGIAAMFGWSGIKDLLAFGWDAITGLFTSIGDWWDSLDFMTPLTEAWNSITGIFTSVGDWWDSLDFMTPLTAAWDSITSFFSMDTLYSISDVFKTAWETVTGFFSFGEEGFSISALATKAWDTVTGFFKWSTDAISFSISGLLTTAWETITGFFSFGKDATGFSISGLLTTAWETVTGMFGFGDLAIPSIKDLFQGIIDKVKGFFTFDFKMPNFKQYLPKWLGGEGKSFLGSGETAVETPEAPDPASLDSTQAQTGLSALQQTQSVVQAFASIPELQNNLETLKKGLDINGVRTYTSAMESLVEVLGKLNDELAKDNKYGPGKGSNAGDVVAKMDSIGGGGGNSDQLNSTMGSVLAVLSEIRDIELGVQRNTKNMANGNIATSSVSVLPG